MLTTSIADRAVMNTDMNIGVNTGMNTSMTRVITGVIIKVKVKAAAKTIAMIAAIARLPVHGGIHPPEDHFLLLGHMCNHYQYRLHRRPSNHSNGEGNLL
jgi:hypothetical protein